MFLLYQLHGVVFIFHFYFFGGSFFFFFPIRVILYNSDVPTFLKSVFLQLVFYN